MTESDLFIFGIFVTLIFLIGVGYTVREFQKLSEDKRGSNRPDRDGIKIEQ